LYPPAELPRLKEQLCQTFGKADWLFLRPGDDASYRPAATACKLGISR
jgi:hypothetical protein